MRKFKYKLSHKDMTVLIQLLDSISKSKSTTIIGFIATSLLRELKTRIEVKSVLSKKDQTITMKDYEAVNFWIVINPMIAYGSVDTIQIQKMCNEIHKQVISHNYLSLK